MLKPVLTTSDTKAGEAVVLKDGCPLVETDDGQVPWDVAKQAKALSDANREAQERRQALEDMARAVGIQADVRTGAGIEALKAEVAKLPTIATEHKKLLEMKNAGELDHTAAEKIKDAASKMREDEFAEVLALKAKAEKEAADARALADRSISDLNSALTRQALTEFHRAYKGFANGSGNSFERAALAQTTDGYRWRPTGRRDENGVPVLALMDEEGNLRKGPDQVTPMTLEAWTENVLKKTDPILFQQNGNTGGYDFDGNRAGKPLHELPQEELIKRARLESGV